MKKITLTAALMFLCAGLAFSQNGVIREVSGTVEIKRAGSTAFVPARVGDQLTGDTVVSTGFKSTALVAVGSSVITVKPLTRLALSELGGSAGAETINVGLQTGRVRVDVNPPAGTKTNMTVRAPNATASVRGTSFDFDTKNLEVHEGTVAFKGRKGGVVRVSAGSSSWILPDGRAADPIETSVVNLAPPSIETNAADLSPPSTAGESQLEVAVDDSAE